MSKKGIRWIVVGLLMSLAFTVNSYGLEFPVSEFVEENGTETIDRAEKAVWKYRTVNGVKQKRLWSLTHERWKTDWITL